MKNKLMKAYALPLLIIPVFLLGFTAGKKSKESLIQDKEVTQVGIVTDDIERTARAWTNFLGLEEVPKINIAAGHDSRPTAYKGKPSGARAKLAFFQLDNLTIELIEPLEGPSTWQEFLDKHGPGIHHIAFNTGDMKTSVKLFEEAGIMEDQHGGWGTGEYAYMNGSGTIELIIELLEHYEQ